MNNNPTVLPNFAKGLAVSLFIVFSSISVAEHHAKPEMKDAKAHKTQEGAQIEELDLEITPLSEDELKMKAENTERMNQMTEIMSDEAPVETPK